VHSGTLHSWMSRWRRNGSASSGQPAEPAPGGRLREAERAELERLRRDLAEKSKRIRELEMERDVLGDQRTEHHVPHRLACRVLGVSESWFYKWRDKPTAAREVRRGQLADAIRQVFENSGGTYGSPKAWLLLIRAGRRVSVNTVARLMAELGLAGRKIRRRAGCPAPANGPRSRTLSAATSPATLQTRGGAAT